MRRLLVVMCCGLLVPAAAHAAGGPVPPVMGGVGASAPRSAVTYVTVSAGGHRTVVERIRRDGGAVEATRLLRGAFRVPGVAFDGSTTGLSADGRTLVLADARSRTPTRLLVLDARRLRPRAYVSLPGYFTVDAISPDGRWLYLIRYRSPRNLSDYEVRAYDLRARRVLAKPVVDPREPDEQMQGTPVARTVSRDGRWAYTLYDRGDAAPFIHALDTQARTARCIDLDDLSGGTAERRLTLTDGGATLRVDDPAGPLALVDTRTFAVRPPAAHGAASAPRSDDGGGVPWPLAFVAVVPLAGLAVVARRRRRTAA